MSSDSLSASLFGCWTSLWSWFSWSSLFWSVLWSSFSLIGRLLFPEASLDDYLMEPLSCLIFMYTSLFCVRCLYSARCTCTGFFDVFVTCTKVVSRSTDAGNTCISMKAGSIIGSVTQLFWVIITSSIMLTKTKHLFRWMMGNQLSALFNSRVTVESRKKQVNPCKFCWFHRLN